MNDVGMLIFDAVCPACGDDCPYIELEKCDACAGGYVIERRWYCAKSDMCRWLWERMQREAGKA